MKAYFAIVGAVCLACAFWLLLRRLRVLLHGAATVGLVVAHEARQMDEALSYLPVVSFKDAKGREHRFTSVAGWSVRRPSMGTSVSVRYLPSDPKVAYVSSFLHMWAAPFALAVLGGCGGVLLWMR